MESWIGPKFNPFLVVQELSYSTVAAARFSGAKNRSCHLWKFEKCTFTALYFINPWGHTAPGRQGGRGYNTSPTKK